MQSTSIIIQEVVVEQSNTKCYNYKTITDSIMNKVPEYTFELKNNDCDNFDWVHERDSILLNLLRQKKNITPFKPEYVVRGKDQLMNQHSGAYYDQQPFNDIQFQTEPFRNGQDPDLWIDAQNQSVIQQQGAHLYELSNTETENALNAASFQHGYGEAQGQTIIDQKYPTNQLIDQEYQLQCQSNFDQTYQANQMIEQSYLSNNQVTINGNHQIQKIMEPTYQLQNQSTIGLNQSQQMIYQTNQLYQGMGSTYPEPGPSVQNNATKKAEAEIIALGQVTRSTLATIEYTRVFQASSAKEMVSRPTQTLGRNPSGTSVSIATQVPPPTEDSASGINCPRIKRLFHTLRKLDRNQSFRTTSEIAALKLRFTRQMILQSVNLQLATINKSEAQSISRLCQQSPLPTRPPPKLRGSAYRAKPCTAGEFSFFLKMNYKSEILVG